jgi:hypothetical protein
VADQAVAAADDGTLADDATYQTWTQEVGDAGVVNMYAAPAAGDYLAQSFSRLMSVENTSVPPAPDDDVVGMLKDFRGAAATIRFTGDGLELAAAGDLGQASGTNLVGDQAGALAARLPDDTAAAVAISLSPGFIRQYLDQVSGVMGGSSDQMLRELSAESGLDVPDDIETLLGSATAISVSKDFDFEAASNSSDPSGLPVGALVRGDASGIEDVLGKLRARLGDESLLGSDSSGDLVAIGPSPDYRHELLTGGHLGDSDAFRSVIAEPDRASAVFFLDFDALEPSISQAAAGDQEVTDNIEPLQAIGMSTWRDGTVSHVSLKIGTN